MGAIERDPGETAAQLAAWLLTRPGLADVEVGEVAIPSSTGWSNETILFDATWTADGERVASELVARIAPTEHQVFPDDTFTLQYDVMRALAERTEVPVATVHWFEPDTAWFGQPFWIMERIRGDVPTDNPPYAGGGWLLEATVEEQAKAWWSGIDAMAGVHRLDLAELGLPAGTLPIPADLVGAQLDACERFLTWAEEGEPHALARTALARLRADPPPPPAEGPALSWGDSRMSNLIYRDFEVAAVLDWEMASVADPLVDLAWWLFSDDALTTGAGLARLPGFASAADTARHWEARTGRSADALDAYVLLAGLRFTIIMLRIGGLLAQIGLMPRSFGYDNHISQALDDLLQRS